MAYRPQVLTVPNGGTGDTTLTNHGVLLGQGTSAVASTAAGSAGQVLQSGGASADPTYSTATFPSTATGTGKILRADGTNWVASTATYPDTAGTSGNVLTSNGTNWVSSTPSAAGLLVASGTLTNAQIKALHASPVTVIAAPGSGNVIQVITYAVKLNYGGTSAFTNGGGSSLSLRYSNLTDSIDNTLTAAMIGATSSQLDGGSGTGFSTSSTYSSYDNSGVVFYNSSATEWGGNAANDNTIPYSILYRILTL